MAVSIIPTMRTLPIDISRSTVIKRSTNFDALPYGVFPMNLWESYTPPVGAGVPTKYAVGLVWHVKLKANSFAQFIFSDQYYAVRMRATESSAWSDWKYAVVTNATN